MCVNTCVIFLMSQVGSSGSIALVFCFQSVYKCNAKQSQCSGMLYKEQMLVRSDFSDLGQHSFQILLVYGFKLTFLPQYSLGSSKFYFYSLVTILLGSQGLISISIFKNTRPLWHYDVNSPLPSSMLSFPGVLLVTVCF